MDQVSDPRSKTTSPDVDTWPWRCLGCEGTIYHDVELCHDCRLVRPVAHRTNRRHPVAEFLDWIRREPYPTFVTKVTAVASLEIALTTLWLHLMLFGSAGVGYLPVVT